ncbi:DNA cytosine methyltransferase, partial [Desulfofundulus sp.]|uniref:DNA cytosine methyltransferase n=1 Tax=Desulfofundulus sp. TaxID=2282750 RepID=UPI003C775C3A
RLIKYDMSSFEDKYRKHSWDRPCTTVFAHLEKDGNRFIHPDSNQARTFTVREVARIQSFPDDFVFTAPGNVRYRYVGNAVPPLMAKAIGEAIYQVLESLRCKGERIAVCLAAR